MVGGGDRERDVASKTREESGRIERKRGDVSVRDTELDEKLVFFSSKFFFQDYAPRFICILFLLTFYFHFFILPSSMGNFLSLLKRVSKTLERAFMFSPLMPDESSLLIT